MRRTGDDGDIMEDIRYAAFTTSRRISRETLVVTRNYYATEYRPCSSGLDATQAFQGQRGNTERLLSRTAQWM